MKKRVLLSIAAAWVLLGLSLVACSGRTAEAPGVAEEPTAADTEPEPTDIAESEPTDTAQPEPTAAPEVEPTETAEPQPTEATAPEATEAPAEGSGAEIPAGWPATAAELPPGNAADAEELYNTTYACTACHGQLDQPGTEVIGPHHATIAARDVISESGAGTLEQYIYESVLIPNAYISPDCPQGPCADPSVMPANFAEQMTPQELADIIALIVAAQTGE